MKRFLFLAMMFMPFNLMAAIPQFDTLVDKYADNEAVMTTTIDRDMIALFAGEMVELDMVDKIQVILSEDAKVGQKIVADAKDIAKRAKAEALIDNKALDVDVEVYTIKDGDVITDILAIIAVEDQMGAIVISGRVTLDALSKLIHIV